MIIWHNIARKKSMGFVQMIFPYVTHYFSHYSAYVLCDNSESLQNTSSFYEVCGTARKKCSYMYLSDISRKILLYLNINNKLFPVNIKEKEKDAIFKVDSLKETELAFQYIIFF